MRAKRFGSLQIAALSLLLCTGAAIAADDKDADQPPVARGPASAQPREAQHTQQNSSTFNEVTADVHAKFDALDVDHDGTIDQHEAAVSNILGSQFSGLDSNGDGKLSMNEFSAASDLASIKTPKGDRDQK